MGMLYLETGRYGCNMPCIVYSGMGMLYLETGGYGCNMPCSCILVWVCFMGGGGVACFVYSGMGILGGCGGTSVTCLV